MDSNYTLSRRRRKRKRHSQRCSLLSVLRRSAIGSFGCQNPEALEVSTLQPDQFQASCALRATDSDAVAVDFEPRSVRSRPDCCYAPLRVYAPA
jgi:hypothetical protein